MATVTEELQKESVENSIKSAKAATETGKVLMNGIALILNSSVFSEEAIMKALDKKIEKTGNLEDSYANVSMEELLNGKDKVEKINEPVLKEAMRYFDRYCREYNVKYSALKTSENGEKESGRERYIIFFKAKNDKIVDHVMSKAIADWQKDQEQLKKAGKETAAEKMSVMAKLTFFLNRAKEDVNQDKSKSIGKNNDKMRTQDLER